MSCSGTWFGGAPNRFPPERRSGDDREAGECGAGPGRGRGETGHPRPQWADQRWPWARMRASSARRGSKSASLMGRAAWLVAGTATPASMASFMVVAVAE